MPRTPIPPELALGPFTVRLGRAFNLSNGRLRGRDLQRPFRGVRAVTYDSTDLFHRCLAYAERMPRGQFFSHVTAARLLGVPLPWRLLADERLHVCTVAPRRSPQMRGIVGHNVREQFIAVDLRTGVPTATPPLIWRQLAALLTVDELVAVGDYFLRRKNPLMTSAELAEATRRHAGLRGARTLVAAAERVRAGVDSPKETQLRLLLIDHGLPEPVVNFEVKAGGVRHLLDLSYPERRVALEYEGDGHRTDRSRWRNDIRRRERLEDELWSIIRVTDDDLKLPTELVARVRRRIARQAARLNSSPSREM
jgi:hypothetical protein